MELKQYWGIVRERFWVVIAATVLALVASAAGLVLIPQSVTHQATVRLAIKLAAEARVGDFYTYSEYYPYLTSEFLADDIVLVVQSSSFMDDLRKLLASHPGGAPFGSIRAAKTHRIVTLTATSGTAEGALALAGAAADALAADAAGGARYFAKVTDQRLVVAIVDPPQQLPGATTRASLDLLLRALVGLIAGVGLAFLLDYLDDTIRDGRDAERVLGLPVIGEIPGERRRRLWEPRRKPATART